MKTKKFKVEITKSGVDALWENGGSATNTGEGTIICDRFGGRKKAIYVRRKGHLSNAEHALIPVEIGDVIVKSYHKRRDFWIRVYKVTNFDGEYAVTKLLYEYSRGEWNESPPEFLQNAINAGKDKASCYHCRSPHYVIDPRIQHQ